MASWCTECRTNGIGNGGIEVIQIMNKRDYIIRQISKTNKKNYENYVVTGIWHLVSNINLKIITQQYVVRPNGYALTDMYFPQINFHIEIDEPHHYKQKMADLTRESDIIDATGHKIKRIDISLNLDEIDSEIRATALEIKDLVCEFKSKGQFLDWNLDMEFDPNYYKSKGKISLDEGATFLRVVDICNCFGHKYDGYYKGWAINNLDKSQHLWFPKFYENAHWDNKISDDGLTIIEKHKAKDSKHFNKIINEETERVTFPRVRDNLGFTFYRFKGVFKLDKNESSHENGLIYKRIKTEVQTG